MTDEQKLKRKSLQDLSRMIGLLIKEGVYSTINEGLMALYADTENLSPDDFKTFHQWKHEGFHVKKGEKAFMVWGSPIGNKNKENQPQPEPADKGEDAENLFFPICYLFSSKQVEKNTAEMEEQEPLKNAS